jgi:hypothetical protein
LRQARTYAAHVGSSSGRNRRRSERSLRVATRAACTDSASSRTRKWGSARTSASTGGAIAARKTTDCRGRFTASDRLMEV